MSQTSIDLGRHGGYSLAAVQGASPTRTELEAASEAAGVPLSLPQRAVWDPISPADRTWFVTCTPGGGSPDAAFAVRSYRSRALPFHRVLRTERFLGGIGPEASTAAFHAAARLAHRLPRVLRAHVEIFDPTGQILGDLANAARTAGFEQWPHPRVYDRTVTVELDPEEDEIFSSFHSTGRRHVRSQFKNAVEVRPIGPDQSADELNRLLQETLERTGGGFEPHRWEEILELSDQRPDLSRVIGLFRTDDGNELLAYAWGCNHGRHAHYSTAASTRHTDLKVAMAYPLAWDLIKWAKSSGAEIFDFGGISSGTADSKDPLGGISDFKRRFTKNVVRVGDEWVYSPHPLRQAVADRLSQAWYTVRELR